MISRPRYAVPVQADKPVPAPQDRAISFPAKVGFGILCVYTLLLFSRGIEFIDSTGSLHLMIILAIPTVILAIISGGFVRAVTNRIGICLSLFTGWAILALPFSTWRGGSVTGFMNSWAKSFISFLLVAGLLVSVNQMRKFALVIASAVTFMLAVVNLHAIRDADNRLFAQWGTLGNANDLATVILIGLPFCAYVITDKKRVLIVRIFFAAVSIVSILTVLRTGSRGGLITILLVGAFLFVKLSPGHKIVVAFGLLVFLASLPFVLTPELRARYMTILQSGDAEEAIRASRDGTVVSALQSTEARRDLIKHALQLSIAHPVFGVGFQQFPVADANRAQAGGESAYWHEVHNIFAMVLVENGFPALIFYAAAVYFSFRAADRTFKRVRKDPAHAELARFSFCLLTALTIFFICNNFATDAYGFQLPLLGGIAAALEVVYKREVQQSLPAVQPLFLPRTPRKLSDPPVISRRNGALPCAE